MVEGGGGTANTMEVAAVRGWHDSPVDFGGGGGGTANSMEVAAVRGWDDSPVDGGGRGGGGGGRRLQTPWR